MAVRRCLPVRLTRRGTIVKPPRPKKKSASPQSGGANPQWLDAVYRYRTTPEAVAHALLNHSNLRIVTNNLNVANTLMVKEDFRIILAGGELRSRDGGIIGEATLDFISQFRLDFGILGISGIDSDGSLLEFDYHEVRTKRAIIENSRHVMLVVDHSKFGRNAMVNMGSISMVDAVYTDTPPPVSVMQVLTDHHIQLELC